MATCDSTILLDPGNDPDVTAEVRAMIGVFATFTRMQSCFDEMDGPCGDDMPDNQRHLLVKLDQPRRMGDLAQVMNQLPSSLTAIADALETRGLVMRERDPSDRRAWLLRLTDEGTAFRTDMLAQAGSLFRDVTGLNDDDIHTLADIGDKMRQNIMKNMLQKGAPE